MFKGFDSTIGEMQFRTMIDRVKVGLWDHLSNAGRATRDSIRNCIKARIVSGKWVLSGNDIESNWFPQMQNHVFISHSHKDEDLALALSGALKYWLGIDAFVDSSVWGYYAQLQSLIYEKVIQLRNVTSAAQKIELWNSVTSHVHCMLTKSLIQMMDQCECLLFLNTPASIGFRDIKGTQETYSPWIYTEVEVSRFLRTHKDSRRPKTHLIKEGVESFAEDAEINNIISYPLNLDHMTKIGFDEIWNWIRNGYTAVRNMAVDADKPFLALDVLYGLR